MTIALDAIQNNSSILENKTISFTVKDDGCDERRALGMLVTLVKDHNIDAVIGPACSSTGKGIGKLGSYWNIPIIAYSGTSAELSDKTIYDTYSRTRNLGTTGGHIISIIAESMSWNKICTYWRDMANLRHLMEGLQNSVEIRNITILEPVLHLPSSWGNYVKYRKAMREDMKRAKGFCRGKRDFRLNCFLNYRNCMNHFQY